MIFNIPALDFVIADTFVYSVFEFSKRLHDSVIVCTCERVHVRIPTLYDGPHRGGAVVGHVIDGNGIWRRICKTMRRRRRRRRSPNNGADSVDCWLRPTAELPFSVTASA